MTTKAAPGGAAERSPDPGEGCKLQRGSSGRCLAWRSGILDSEIRPCEMLRGVYPELCEWLSMTVGTVRRQVYQCHVVRFSPDFISARSRCRPQ